MAGKNEKTNKVKGISVPKFDQMKVDFFRGSRGNMFNKVNTFAGPRKDFTGFRRGSK